MRLVPCGPPGGSLFVRVADDEVDPVVFSDAPSSAPLPGGPEIEAPAEADSPTSVARTSPSD